MAPLVLKSSSSGTSILVIGGTGTIGRHLVTASLDAGHPTAVLARPAAAAEDPARASLLEAFKTRGASLIYVRAQRSLTCLAHHSCMCGGVPPCMRDMRTYVLLRRAAAQ